MKVFKFGGASVNSVERIQNLPSILQQYSNESLVIIISAMGKTTNALEKVAEAFYNNDKTNALQLFTVIGVGNPGLEMEDAGVESQLDKNTPQLVSDDV